MCVDSNNDSKCNPREVKQGLTAWQARFDYNDVQAGSKSIVFGYPYPPGRP